MEIISDSDAGERAWAEKLEHYRQAGVAEVVRFEAADVESPLRIWDLLDGDIVERDPSDPHAFLCDALGLHWCIVEDAELGPFLRLARDPAGKELVPTPVEAERARVAELEAQKVAAQTRVAELEAELGAKR